MPLRFVTICWLASTHWKTMLSNSANSAITGKNVITPNANFALKPSGNSKVAGNLRLRFLIKPTHPLAHHEILSKRDPNPV